MKKKSLGGLEVGAQGLGCAGLTGFYGRPFDGAAAAAAVHAALDHGVTFFDTSDSYGHATEFGFGCNEEFLGKALKGRRNEAVIGTKFGFLPSAGGVQNGAHLAERGVSATTVRADPGYIRSACEASLKRLGVDYIDLYFAHRLSPEVPVEETVGAIAELVRAGKVGHIGLCGVSAELLDRAAAVHPIAALESEWSLWTRDIEYEVLAVARRHNIGIVTYAPLGRGFLTGQLKSFDDLPLDDLRRTFPRFQGENFKKNLELVDHIHEMARQKGCTAPQLALAWLDAKGDDVVPIPGGERPEFVIDNVGALGVELSAQDVEAIDAIFPLGAASGARYANMSNVSDAVDTSKLATAKA